MSGSSAGHDLKLDLDITQRDLLDPVDRHIGCSFGNYVVKRKVGEGTSSWVYLAVHPDIHRQVAIKILKPQYHHLQDVARRFVDEARTGSAIRNDHVIEILDYGKLADGTPYLITEWLSGRSLADELKKHGPLSLARVRHIATGIGRALAAAHAMGIVHRDLKPENIFLTYRGQDCDFVKVFDFGIAKVLSAKESATWRKTHPGVLWGTPAYMSPEQCGGASHTIDTRSDIYAFGVLVHELISGELPFSAATPQLLLLDHLTKAPPPLRTVVGPHIPVTVEAAVLCALQKESSKRFETVEAFVKALYRDPAPFVATVIHKVPPRRPSPLRRSLLWTAALLGGAAALWAVFWPAGQPLLVQRLEKQAALVSNSLAGSVSSQPQQVVVVPMLPPPSAPLQTTSDTAKKPTRVAHKPYIHTRAKLAAGMAQLIVEYPK